MMKRCTAGGGESGGGQQSGKQKDVTAHVSPADHVGFMYVSEGNATFQSGHLGAQTRQEVRLTQRNIMMERLENMKKKKEDPSPLQEVL